MNDKTEQCDQVKTKTRILIVDDHSIVRRGLAGLINQEPELIVSDEAENATRALEIIESGHIDLAIIDISMEGMNGIQLTEQIKTHRPDIPVVILSMHDELSYAKRAFSAGARGYIVKHEAAEKIIPAIHHVLGGKVHVSERMAKKIIDANAFEYLI
jgi:DNA-binding NarL/FixJ family response regulator